jgi:NAD(P)H dehydrogenase (quinone)
MTIAIAGGTGRVGSGVTRQLLDRGERVRVLTRDVGQAAARLGQEDGLELAGIDFDDPRDLAEKLRGSDRVFIALGTAPTQVDNETALIDAAVAAGVPYLVEVSVEGVETDSANVILGIHRAIEDRLSSAGIPCTVIRPTTYIDAIVAIAAGFIPRDAWGGNTAGGRAAFVDIRDVAEVAAAVLAEGPNAHAGRKYVVSGPEALSMEQVAELFSAALGHLVRFHQRGEDENKAFLSAFGLPEARVDVLLALDQLTRDNSYASVSSDTATILGRPARPASLFINENAPSLLPSLASWS